MQHNKDPEFDRYFAIYEKEFVRYREIDDNALEYFRKELDKRYPDGDYKAFLREAEKLSTEEIQSKAKELGYTNCHVPGEKRYTLSEMRNSLFSQIKNDAPTNVTPKESDNAIIIDDSEWTKPQGRK